MIEAMKQALEALELAVTSHDVLLLSDPPQDAWKARSVTFKAAAAMQALRAAIAEAEKQEPVAWLNPDYGTDEYAFSPEKSAEWCVPLYTHFPRREWVGLTEDDLNFWSEELGVGELGRGVLRAVDEHLKEKNT